jgi:hypothetical protein
LWHRSSFERFYCDIGALMPICVISVATCTRPALPSSCASGPRNIRAPVARQSIARQFPRGRNGKLHVQLVPSRRLHANDCGAADPAPQLQIGVRDRARLAMTPPRLIPSTPARRLTLSFDVRSIIFLRATLAHAGMRCRATGQQRRLAERTGQKIVLQRQLSNLRMQGLHVDDRLRLGF